MVGNQREIKVFVGFQIKSKYHDRIEIETCFRALASRISNDYNVALRITYGIFLPGKILWDEVRNAIRECDIALFDVSENNPNVMIELGLAYGFRKRVFMLKCKESAAEYPLPSDLAAAIYVQYKKNAFADTTGEVEKGILNYLQTPENPSYYAKSLWGFSEYDSVLVICSELDEPEKKQHPEPNEYIYLSKYGDVDSLVEVLVTLHKIFPELNVTFRSANEVGAIQEKYTDNLILIGGPDYNKITQYFQEFSPYEYLQGRNEYDIRIGRKGKGDVFIPKINEEEGLKKIVDYGFFIKRRNPYDPKKKLIMVGGSHTYGVFGAIKAFSWYESRKDDLAFQNCKDVVESLGHDPNFSALFEVHGLESSVLTPKLNKDFLESL